MKTLIKAGIVVIGIVFSGAVLVQMYPKAHTAYAGEAVRAVEPGTVCMVNDTVMGRPQIPVEFDGRTYYGCCQGCVGRIKEDPSVRSAVDPVSGRQVDKARAVILEGPEGAALYFESEETARSYTEASR